MTAVPHPPLEPPAAPRRPHRLSAHGTSRDDDWYWLRDVEDPQVIAYLEAENSYADAVLAPTAPLQQQIFESIKSRVQETDAGPPAWGGGWWYYQRTEAGSQYPILCRLADRDRQLTASQVADLARSGEPADEAVVLDQNTLSAGDYLAVGVLDLSPDHQTLAYAVDLDGSELYELRFRRVADGAELSDVVPGVYYGSAWSADGGAFFYVKPDETMRPWQVWCHQMGTPATSDRLVFEEEDERFFVDVDLSRSHAGVMIHASSKTTSEIRWLSAGRTGDDPVTLLPRRPGVEYHVEHDGDGWLVLSNQASAAGEPATNFALYHLDRPGGELIEVLGHRQDVKLESVECFAEFTAVIERVATDGSQRVRILGRDGSDHLVEIPESPYTLLGGQNPEWEQTTYRFGYTSLVTPRTSIDYDVATRTQHRVWSQLVPGGYDPRRYRTERVWAVAPDGTRVPVSVLAPADQPLDGTAAGLLYGYGAYEISIDPEFSVSALSLVERGLVYAIAHIRGGGELGRSWYDQGKMEHKANTFTDFVAAAEALVAAGWVDPGRLAARGGSAGGLLMGAVTNLRPELWRAVVAEVPFVDVVTTMSDVSLPLTVTEWEEWGDPLHDPEAFQRMLAYSPYDNVVPLDPPARYPAVYATAGISDPRVGFWEPAKWVAKLRSVGAGTGDHPVLLRTEMGAGHQGPSGRYDSWRDEARAQAFLLTQLRR